MPYADRNGPLDLREWESFMNYYGKFIEKVPEIKMDAIKAAGEVLQKEVQTQIDTQGIVDGSGKVKRWQQLTFGSKGGYARVHPDKSSTSSTWRGKRVNASQLTGFLDRGHMARKPSGKNPNYQSRIEGSVFGKGGAVVKGRRFYSWARFYGERKALDAAERALDRITDEWEWD